MHILLATESFYPLVSGVAIMVQRLAEEMSIRGHEVTVITTGRTSRLKKESFQNYTVYHLPAQKSPFKKGYYIALRPGPHIRKIFAEVHPEIVHIHEPNVLGMAMVKEARAQGIPVLATHHFSFESLLAYLPLLKPAHYPIERFLRANTTRLYNRCNKVTAPSRSIGRQILTRRLQTPLEVLSNGVDMQKFHPAAPDPLIQKRFGINPELPVVLYTGRIDPEKNIEVLIRSLGEVSSPYQLVLVGKGKSMASLKQLAESLKVRAIWTSLIPYTALPALYNLGTIYCMPSPGETESIATMEAMASGLPVVGADSGALPELIVPQENGLLVAPDNTKSWTEAIEKLLQNPALQKEMGKKSVEIVQQRNLEKSLNRFEAIYQELIDSSLKR